MRIIAAYALAVLGGNQNPSEQDITKIIESVGMQVDSARLTKFLEEVKDKVSFNDNFLEFLHSNENLNLLLPIYSSWDILFFIVSSFYLSSDIVY